ncbi:MAG: DUF2065 domain-containing protein [Pseudomonadota bacterium]|nr:DUF2065 domain-containing protein [Pseudomonadota bacterium]
MWDYVLTGVALVLVIEGIMPFIWPRFYQKLLMQMVRADVRVLRIVGLVLMLIGTLMLYIIHTYVFHS